MDRKLTSAVYAAVEKAYDHRCDIEDAADEILEIIEADRQGQGGPVFAWYDPTTGLFTRNKNDPDSGIPAGSCLWPLYREAPTLHNSVSGAPNADQAPQPAEPSRGEPVLYTSQEALDLTSRSDAVISVGLTRVPQMSWNVPLYTAPQPAESCASLMSDKTACGSENGDCASQPAEPVKNTCKKCNGTGVESTRFHGVWPNGEECLEPIKCDQCDGFGTTSVAEPVKVPSEDGGETWSDTSE